MREERICLLHIVECIERIEHYTRSGRRSFMHNTKTQDAVLRNLQVMAESTQRLSDELRETQPQIAWSQIAGFRNVLVHDYLGINLERVWQTVERDLPELKQAVTTMLEYK